MGGADDPEDISEHDTQRVEIVRVERTEEDPAQRRSLLERTVSMPAIELTHKMERASLPSSIGRYTVLDLLGRGGMAEVFLTKQAGPAGFEKQVVVKRSLPHLADNPRFVEMFLREARVAARLNHPNVVQIYELGDDDGSYFIAMEYVEGLTLHRLARRAWRTGRSVPMEVALRAIADAALGLAHAHEVIDSDGRAVTLVHRDISPDNLIINKDGVTKVLDFGIAKASDTQTVTKSGEIKGKIPFMSPEQVRGERVDKRTDLYALGVCLYWLLTGERPFDGNSDFLTMSAVCEDTPVLPSEKNPRVPAVVDRIVMRLLEKDPDARFQSGSEVHDRLAELIPAGRTASLQFVRSVISLPDAADDFAPPSEGFLPATPLSTHLGPAPALRSLVVERPRYGAWIAASGAAAALIALGATAMLASLDDDAGGAVEALPVVVMPAPPLVAARPDPPPQDPPLQDVPAATQEEKASVPAAEPAHDVAASQAPAAPPERVQRRSYRSVDVKAPAYVEWRLGRRALGRGEATLKVPLQARSLTAVDTRNGGEAVVTVEDSIDYGSLPKGSLEVRVFPYAEVLLGGASLGTTPLLPRSLVVGTYRVTLRYQGNEEVTVVEVSAGGKAVVKKSFDATPTR